MPVLPLWSFTQNFDTLKITELWAFTPQNRLKYNNKNDFNITRSKENPSKGAFYRASKIIMYDYLDSTQNNGIKAYKSLGT